MLNYKLGGGRIIIEKQNDNIYLTIKYKESELQILDKVMEIRIAINKLMNGHKIKSSQSQLIKTAQECIEKLLNNPTGIYKEIIKNTKNSYYYRLLHHNYYYYMISYDENKLQIFKDSSDKPLRVMTAYEFIPTSINIENLSHNNYTHKAILNLSKIIQDGEMIETNSSTFSNAIKNITKNLPIKEINSNFLGNFK